MQRKHNPKLVTLAKNLRNNMTEEEKQLWYQYLRNYPIRFIRQKILGNYIVDFYCAKARIVIELDGSQHYKEADIKKDKIRTAFLEEYGITVLRFTNDEIKENFFGVCEYIDKRVTQILNQRKD